MTKLLAQALVLCAAVAVLGCGGGSQTVNLTVVSGKVTTADGRPLPGGQITFTPASGKGPVGMGTINPDGTYNTSMEAGDYNVSVDNTLLKANTGRTDMPGTTDSAPGKYVAYDGKFLRPDTSGLSTTVPASGPHTYNVSLK